MTGDDYVLKITASPDHAGSRLDRVVVDHLADTSRSFVQRMIDAGDVLVNGEERRPSYKLSAGDLIEVRAPAPEAPEEVTPADILIPIAYEDDDIIVFDNPAGLVVHPAPGHRDSTLVNAFRWLRPENIQPGTERPGIVHRLDKDTSGLIVVAKNERSRLHLLRVWQNREVRKEYTGLVAGEFPEDQAVVDAPIDRDPNNRKRMAVVQGGKRAVSHLKVIERFPGFTLMDIEIETGRTHQIRVHCAFTGHPIAGDRTYGGYRQNIPLERQFLHARRLRFNLLDGRPIDLSSPIPSDLQRVLELLRERAA
ncbi:RluA family pseudouridine synthase [soil metagenome]